jgi:hypothetical protein
MRRALVFLMLAGVAACSSEPPTRPTPLRPEAASQQPPPLSVILTIGADQVTVGQEATFTAVVSPSRLHLHQRHFKEVAGLEHPMG